MLQFSKCACEGGLFGRKAYIVKGVPRKDEVRLLVKFTAHEI
jgi:hypothetical protein